MALVALESPGGGRIKDLSSPRSADVVSVPRSGGGTVPLHRVTASALVTLQAAAAADGNRAPLLRPVSGYRTVKHQQDLWAAALRKYGSASVARRWVAPPGHSAHQTGRAIDFYLGGSNSSGNTAALRRTRAYNWLVKNAHRFGFYPYANEPWHWEYNPPASSASVASQAGGGWLFGLLALGAIGLFVATQE